MQHPPTPEQLAALTTGLSAERLTPYLQATSDHQAALELYMWNLRLSAAFNEAIAVAEVVLRNSMHRQLTSAYGTTWYLRTNLFDDRTARGLTTAWSQIKMPRGRPKKPQNVPPGKLIAEMSFGTWTNLLDAGGYQSQPVRRKMDYSSTLWRTALHLAFPNSSGSRRTVYRTAHLVRTLRNRVAHHEHLLSGIPLHGEYDASGRHRRLTCAEAHDAVLELVRYVDTDIRDWLEVASRVLKVLTQRP